MTRIAIPLSILAVAALAACSSYSGSAPEAHAAPVVPQTMSYQPGMGVVDNVVVAPSPMSSSRGGTATGASSHPAGTSATDRPEPRVGTPSSSAGRLNRLTVRMDNGTTQYIDTDSNEFPRGTRVELTADRMIRKAP